MAISGRTRLVGLLGWPVAHSLSPAMHNAAFRALGLDWRYVPLPVRPDQLAAAAAGLAAMGFAGANVTVPHKQAVVPHLHHISAEVDALGAANTIVVRQDEGGQPLLLGYNTDHRGFIQAVRDTGVEPAGIRALVLGAGGAARAVVYGLVQAGAAAVVILNRSTARAEALAHDLGAGPQERAPRAVRLAAGPLSAEKLVSEAAAADMLINATSVGMSPDDASPWPSRVPLPKHLVVFDLVYEPRQTRLLTLAEAAGARPVGGLGMLVHQAALAFELWTGQAVPVDIMRRAIEKAKTRA